MIITIPDYHNKQPDGYWMLTLDYFVLLNALSANSWRNLRKNPRKDHWEHPVMDSKDWWMEIEMLIDNELKWWWMHLCPLAHSFSPSTRVNQCKFMQMFKAKHSINITAEWKQPNRPREPWIPPRQKKKKRKEKKVSEKSTKDLKYRHKVSINLDKKKSLRIQIEGRGFISDSKQSSRNPTQIRLE